MPRRWIVTFDVASDTGRHAVHQLLGRYGIRILYTVYDIHADDDTIDHLIEQLEPYIKTTDHMLLLPHCDDCRTATRGQTIEQLPPHTWIAP